MNDQTFNAFQRFATSLKESGISEENVAEIVGKATMVVTEKVMTELEACVNDDVKAQLADKTEQEQDSIIREVFQQKHGMSVGEYREQQAEEWVKAFEAA